MPNANDRTIKTLNFQAHLVPDKPGDYMLLTAQMQYVHATAEFDGDTFIRFRAVGTRDFDQAIIVAASPIIAPRELARVIFPPSPPRWQKGAHIELIDREATHGSQPTHLSLVND